MSVENGVPVSVFFDAGCLFCDPLNSAVCIVDARAAAGAPPIDAVHQRSCAVEAAACTAASGGDNSCDLKLWVVWTGTDNTGADLRSAQLRFSRFLAYGAGNTLAELGERIMGLASTAINSLEPRVRRLLSALRAADETPASSTEESDGSAAYIDSAAPTPGPAVSDGDGDGI